MKAKEQLIKLYSNKSKHSNYQILPSCLKTILDDSDVSVKTRYEAERLAYIIKNLDFQGKTVIDIGGNSGYFTFELIEAGAKSVHCYEGNKEHAEFVELAAEALGLKDSVLVTNDYFAFDGSHTDRYDLALLLNVLHHVGDDYGQKDETMEEVQNTIIRQLNSMHNVANVVIFQLGFNWHGNPDNPIFENGSKEDVIELVRKGTESKWNIDSIGIAEGTKQAAVYNDLDVKNIKRDDSIGEFLNRPIFILSSKV